MRPLAVVGMVIIVIAVIAAGGYVINGDRAPVIEPGPGDQTASTDNGTATTTNSTPTSTVTSTTTVQQIILASTTLAIPLPTATSSVDTASWQIYVSHEAGFSIEHPTNLLDSSAAGVFTLTFPKHAYFRWPLQDDAKLTVSVAEKCPKLVDGYERFEPVTFTMNGREYTRTIGTDVGAGQRYLSIAYDVETSDRCYRMTFLDRGANGAGFYVDNTSLIRKYDAEHLQDLTSAIGVANAMVRSLRILAPGR